MRKSEVRLHSAPNDVICEQKLGPTEYRWQQLLGQHSNYGSVDRIDDNSMRHFMCKCARSQFFIELGRYPTQKQQFPRSPLLHIVKQCHGVTTRERRSCSLALDP